PRLDRPAAGRGGHELSREGHRLPRGYGRPRPLRAAVPGLWRARPADRPCGERDELLSPLPDGGTAPRRPRALPAPPGGLAPHAGRTGGAPRSGWGAGAAGHAETRPAPTRAARQDGRLLRPCAPFSAATSPLLGDVPPHDGRRARAAAGVGSRSASRAGVGAVTTVDVVL